MLAIKRVVAWVLVVGFCTVGGAIAEEGTSPPWQVSKSSGEVWITGRGVQEASLKHETVLNPGDTIRTGRGGRVLLVRGEESILIAPNSVVGIPERPEDGLSTTIVQRAGSILLEVEKRNVKHFEVETPFLAAVVKGTQFRVDVNASGAHVQVLRGQVEVADFHSGQIAQVLPGQSAQVSAHGARGLSLSGSGTLQPVEQGKPRASSIERVPVPRGGLTAPHAAAGQQIRSVAAPVQVPAPRAAGHAAQAVSRISVTLGEVKLNVNRVTHGLARDGNRSSASARHHTTSATVWTTTDTASARANGLDAGSSGAGNSAGVTAMTAASSAPVAAASASSSVAGGNGNRFGQTTISLDADSGNGLGKGLGNGLAKGLGNGNGLARGLGLGLGLGLGFGHGLGNALGHDKQ